MTGGHFAFNVQIIDTGQTEEKHDHVLFLYNSLRKKEHFKSSHVG